MAARPGEEAMLPVLRSRLWEMLVTISPRYPMRKRIAIAFTVQFDVGLAALTGKMLRLRCAWLMGGAIS
jgi:hypothetical protein